jgi:hypothetical protein
MQFKPNLPFAFNFNNTKNNRAGTRTALARLTMRLIIVEALLGVS